MKDGNDILFVLRIMAFARCAGLFIVKAAAAVLNHWVL